MSVYVSIVVPVYNSEKYIDECIKSVLNQTCQNYELILVDDASTDRSLEIINEYQTKYYDFISVIELKKNGKQGRARNFGVRKAKGEYILFLDSDDKLDKRACEYLYKEAENQNADIVFCNYECFGVKEEYCSHVDPAYMGKLNIKKKKALLTTSVVPWAKIIKRSLILENKINFPEDRFYEDQATTYLYYLYAKIVSKVDKPLYLYRITDESTSTKRNQAYHFQSLEMAMVLVKRLKARHLLKKYYEEIEYFFIEQVYCMSIERAITQFDVFPLDYAEYLLSALKSTFPNFENNPYYNNYMSDAKRMIIQNHIISKQALLTYISKEDNNDCPNYTSRLLKNGDRLSLLKKELYKHDYKIALWGAGKYGIKIIKCLREYQIYIDNIYDSNLKLVSQNYDVTFVSDYRKIDESTLVIVPFENWMLSVKNLLKKNKIKTNLFNMEIFIRSNIDFYIEKI